MFGRVLNTPLYLQKKRYFTFIDNFCSQLHPDTKNCKSFQCSQLHSDTKKYKPFQCSQLHSDTEKCKLFQCSQLNSDTKKYKPFQCSQLHSDTKECKPFQYSQLKIEAGSKLLRTNQGSLSDLQKQPFADVVQNRCFKKFTSFTG